MNVKSIKQKELLVIETDLLSVRCAVVENSNSPSIRIMVEEISTDVEEALALCIMRLKNEKIKIPKKAVLITPEAIPALVKVPVDETTPQSESNDMIRWEMNNELEAYTMPPHIEAMMISQGLYNDELKQKIEEHYQTFGGISHPPFIDIAMQAGILDEDSREQLEHKQDAWPAITENYSCNWIENDAKSQLVAWLDDSRRDFWFEHLQTYNIQLHAIFPAATAALSALPATEGKEKLVLLAGTVGLITTITVYKDKIQSIDVSEFSQEILPEELLNSISAVACDKIFISGLCFNRNNISDELRIQLPALSDSIDLSEENQSENLSVIGAVCALQENNQTVPSIQLSPLPPPPVFYKRPLAWWMTAAVVAVLFIMTNIVTPHYKLNGILQNIQVELQKDKERTQQRKTFSFITNELKVSKQKHSKLERELQLLETQIEYLKKYYPENNNYVLDLMNSVVENNSRDLTLKECAISHAKGIEISGLALTESAIQTFKTHIQAVTSDYEFSVINYDSTLRGEVGAYQFKCAFKRKPSAKKGQL